MTRELAYHSILFTGPLEKVSVRLAHCLSMSKYRTPDEVRAALIAGKITPKGPWRHYGPATHSELCRKFGIAPEAKPMTPLKTIKAWLVEHGYAGTTDTDAQVAQAALDLFNRAEES